MNNGHFYRINIKFLEPGKLSQDFRTEFQNELDRNAIYLGTRCKPTNYSGSVAINSLELAHECISLAKERFLDEYGEIACYLREFSCATGYMKSMIDADTRTLMNHIQNTKFTTEANETFVERVQSMTG